MSRKRTAASAFAPTKNHAPRSAFAAAKAVAVPVTHHTHLTNTPNIDPRTLLEGVLDLPTHNYPTDTLGGRTEDSVYSIDSDDSSTHQDEYTLARPHVTFSTLLHESATHHRDHASIILRNGQQLVVLGRYDLQVTAGAINVAGALLRSSENRYPIFAPSTHALPVITAKTDSASFNLYHTAESLASLAHLSPLWRRLWHHSRKHTSFKILWHHTDDSLGRTLTVLDRPPETLRLLSSLSSRSLQSHVPIILVTGAKGSGKSTTCRSILNAMVTAPKPFTRSCLFWLDIDPGQPEFSAPGQVTLVQVKSPVFGPAYTHSHHDTSSTRNVIRSHSLAATSPRENMQHYLLCIADLLRCYRQQRIDFSDAPLIVNCTGWVSGSGAHLLHDIVQRVNPTDIVLCGTLDANTTQIIQSQISKDTTMWSLPSLPRTPAIRSAAEYRQMQTMAYFHAGSSNSLQPITSIAPWHVRYHGRQPGIAAILSYHDPVEPEMMYTVLEGMTVSIIAVDASEARRLLTYAVVNDNDDMDMSTSHQKTRITYTDEELPFLQPCLYQAMTPLDPAHSECIGHAMIRGINTVEHTLELITPIPASILRSYNRTLNNDKESDSASDSNSNDQDKIDPTDDQKVLFLVRGKFDSPDWAMFEDMHLAQHMRRAQRNLQRRGADGSRRDSAKMQTSEKEHVAIRNVSKNTGDETSDDEEGDDESDDKEDDDENDKEDDSNDFDEQDVTLLTAHGSMTNAGSLVDRPYIALRSNEAGIGDGVWRQRNLPPRRLI